MEIASQHDIFQLVLNPLLLTDDWFIIAYRGQEHYDSGITARLSKYVPMIARVYVIIVGARLNGGQ